MSDQKPTDILTKKTVTVVIDNEPYVLSTFAFAKTVRLFQYIAELTDAAGLGSATEQMLQEDIITGDVQFSLGNIIGQIVHALPRLLAVGVPSVYRLLGLIVTSNKELRRLEKSDQDVNAILYAKGEEIAYAEDGVDGVVALLTGAVQVIGVETVVKKLLPLLGLLR